MSANFLRMKFMIVTDYFIDFGKNSVMANQFWKFLFFLIEKIDSRQ